MLTFFNKLKELLNMETWTKLFSSILDSTVWQEPAPTKLVWITMLAMKDWDQVVWASEPGLAARAGVTLEECQEALRKLSSPDPLSRSREHEGRRIEKVDRGWRVLNGLKFREGMGKAEMREYKRVKQAEYRRRKATLVEDARKAGVGEAIKDGTKERMEQDEAGPIY